MIASFLSGFLITVLTDGSLSITGIVTLGLVPVWMHYKRFYIRIKLVINATEQTSKTTANNYVSPGVILVNLHNLGKVLLAVAGLNDVKL